MSVNKTTDVTDREGGGQGSAGQSETGERLCQTLLHYLPFAEIETHPAPIYL